jgi:hypothetical protein
MDGWPFAGFGAFSDSFIFCYSWIAFGNLWGLISFMAFFGDFWIWMDFWVQYFRMDHLLFGLALFLDLGSFSQYFSEGVFGICKGFLNMGIWGYNGVMVWDVKI